MPWVSTSDRAREAMADAAIDAVGRLFAAIGIPPTLAELGLPEDKLDWTAEQAHRHRRV